ncbi:AB hydrolase-1 domain-containing protein [Bordetella sputigena]|uniref:alpha/beta fold hydrolase n=1 Tax=Bordetella sputigena TaxID=1416810 RepID=UPI0039EEAF4A
MTESHITASAALAGTAMQGPRRVETGDASFAIVEGGAATGPCVLFSHSIMTTHAMWRPQFDMLCRAGYRVIAYDARGHGASTVSPAPYTVRQLGDDVIGLLDAMNIQAVHFVGLSLGGIVAFDLAARHPRRLASAVICDARADAPESFARPWDERIALARAEGMQALASPTVARWFGAAARETEEARAVHRLICDTPVEGFAGTAMALKRFDFLAGLAGIRLPVTLVCGDNDGVLPEEMSSLAKRIPGAVLEMIADAGHLPNIENAAAFNAALARHFARVAAR